MERFWPWFAIILNEAYDDRQIYPQSDIDLLRDMQLELNRARQGLREHRRANRPKTAVAAGVLEETDKDKLKTHPANALLELNALAPGQKIEDVLQVVKNPPIDPAVYDTAPTFEDLAAGARLGPGGPGHHVGGDRHRGLGRPVQPENRPVQRDRRPERYAVRDRPQRRANPLAERVPAVVMEVVGPGAVWPQLTAEDVAKNVWLEVEAGGEGLPNKQQEVANIVQLVPLLQRIPGISPSGWPRNSSSAWATTSTDRGVRRRRAFDGSAQPAHVPSAAGPPGEASRGRRARDRTGLPGLPVPRGRDAVRRVPPARKPTQSPRVPPGATNAIQGPETAGALGPRPAHASVRRQRQPPRHRRRHAPDEARRRAAHAMSRREPFGRPVVHTQLAELNSRTGCVESSPRLARKSAGCKMGVNRTTVSEWSLRRQPVHRPFWHLHADGFNWPRGLRAPGTRAALLVVGGPGGPGQARPEPTPSPIPTGGGLVPPPAGSASAPRAWALPRWPGLDRVTGTLPTRRSAGASALWCWGLVLGPHDKLSPNAGQNQLRARP
jgi:hypothetical protein